MNKRIELSPRLRMVADLVPQGARLADIGTDHAYLPAALLMEGKIPSAIAADLREGPLAHARATAGEYGVTEQIDFRLCNGLDGIHPGEADTVVIAGMGGETILEILRYAPWTRQLNVPLILQPMSTMPELRRWLFEHDYHIITEKLAQEGDNLYTALLVQAGKMKPMTPAEEWVGKNRPEPLRGQWLDRWQAKTEWVLKGLAQAKQGQAEERRQLMEQVHDGIVSMKEEWESWQ